jgi:hypothetical protein
MTSLRCLLRTTFAFFPPSIDERIAFLLLLNCRLNADTLLPYFADATRPQYDCAMHVVLTALFLLTAFQQPPVPLFTGSIEGLVVRADTNEPLAKAQITITREKEPIGLPGTPGPVVSDAQGRFIIQNLLPDVRYVLLAARNGFARQQYGERAPRRSGTVITIGAGQAMKDVVFRMVPAGAVSGRVSDASGEPLPGIGVTLLRSIYNEEGRRTFQVLDGVQSDDRGEYRIPLITPGRYFVKGAPPESSFIIEPADIGNVVVEPGYVETYYPGTTDPSRATSVDIRAGAEVSGIDFKLTHEDLFRIRGNVIDAASGQPPHAAFIRVIPRDSDTRLSPQGTDYNSIDGSFELRGIPSGSYWLRANTTVAGPPFTVRAAGQIAVDISKSNAENVILTLIPGFSLQGRIAVDGAPPPGQNVENIPIDLDLVGTGSVDFVPQIQSKQDGVFVFDRVQAGDYRLSVHSQCVKSARLAGADLLKGATLTGPTSEPIEVVLCTKPGIVFGNAVDDDQKPVAGAQAVLVPAERDRRDLYRTSASDLEGRFTIRPIVPGEYKLFVWEDVEPYAYYDAEFLRKFEDLGKPIQIQQSSSETPQIKVIPRRQEF